jgi:hypothetical protein
VSIIPGLRISIYGAEKILEQAEPGNPVVVNHRLGAEAENRENEAKIELPDLCQLQPHAVNEEVFPGADQGLIILGFSCRNKPNSANPKRS